MNTLWAIALVLAAIDDTTSPLPPEPTSHLIPDALGRLLVSRPELLQHHEGFLKQLAARPDLAEAERAWWHSASTPALRNLADTFEGALDANPEARLRFDAYYQALARSAETREAVEHLTRTELDRARTANALPPALRYLRANPDIALRFLRDPRQLRPLPAPLEKAYDDFQRQPDWTKALHDAFQAVADRPDAHLTIFPWWRTQAELEADPETTKLDDALHQRPNEYWLWHARNMNLASDTQAAPWIRYWTRLIQRDTDLAREYGPFFAQLLEDPAKLNQHLAALRSTFGGSARPWPPASSPPALEKPARTQSADDLRRSVTRPKVDPPTLKRPSRPERPTPPTRPTGTPRLEPRTSLEN